MKPQDGLAHFVNAFRVEPVAGLVKNQQFRLGNNACASASRARMPWE